MTGHRSQLAVWGDPVAHSKSPQLHSAAYRALGVDWTYGRQRVDEAGFASRLGSLDGAWRGLSLTMPLKGVAHAAADSLDRRAELTGAVNTLLLGDGEPRGFNTDVGGIVQALRDVGLDTVADARIVGAGATATSALVALAELGARRIEVSARRPEAVAHLTAVGERLGVDVAGAPLDATTYPSVSVTVATLPGAAPLPPVTADALAGAGGALLDVVYGQGETALGAAWERQHQPAQDGLGMLLHQALLQVRIFLTGSVDEPLPREESVLQAMRAAIAEA